MTGAVSDSDKAPKSCQTGPPGPEARLFPVAGHNKALLAEMLMVNERIRGDVSFETDIETLEREGWEPEKAIAMLESGEEWIAWANELLPEMIDLSDALVCTGFFAEDGSARGLIWDLLEMIVSRGDDEFTARAFAFVLNCAESGQAELEMPALIGFVCKVAQPENGAMCLDELAARLPNEMIEDRAGLFAHHYGPDGLALMRAAKSGRRRH